MLHDIVHDCLIEMFLKALLSRDLARSQVALAIGFLCGPWVLKRHEENLPGLTLGELQNKTPGTRTLPPNGHLVRAQSCQLITRELAMNVHGSDCVV